MLPSESVLTGKAATSGELPRVISFPGHDRTRREDMPAQHGNVDGIADPRETLGTAQWSVTGAAGRESSQRRENLVVGTSRRSPEHLHSQSVRDLGE
jgi:hypothetical protein